ncbi:MAG: methylated-DNA--[protein]-cysteine S-methyltransferase [Actinomycetota bacterium]|nr:methylated-DNA--[protein]-cysteine S-methyltransferase [Actinomycetota bacterium]
MLYCSVESPIGELLLAGEEDKLELLSMQGGRHPIALPAGWARSEEAFAPVRAQLDEYFHGRRRRFEVELAPAGSPFELAVWRALLDVPYGETVSYGALASRIGHPGAPRAVGAANGRNPIAVIVPCHRVIGADGSLTGYGGGLERKRLLLDLEAGVQALPL